MTWTRKPKRRRALWVGLSGLKPNGWTTEKSKRPSRSRSASPARARQLRQYAIQRVRFLKRNPRCAVYPRKRATQIHHQRGRMAGLLLDERYWKAVSAAGHDKIHRNLEWARRHGLLAPAGTWNNYERAVAHLETTKKTKVKVGR